ncbi:MAG: gliding motility-associated C-terminal domain-containing protein, partial [Bacteroidales bacterium]
GLFRSTELYVGDDTLVNASPGIRDGFLAKWQSAFSVSITEKINVSCNGYNNGSLVVTPYFGTPPYTYDWSHDAGLNDSTANNLTAGTYKVVVTDGDLKADSVSINISQPAPITITLDSTNLSCYQSGDGAIDITVTGGTVAGDYKYNWTGGAGLNPTGSDQVNLFAGYCRVTVTDDNNCQAFDSTTIIQPNPITYAGTVITPSIPPGSCSGSIDLEVQGGTPDYSYEWAKGGIPMPGRTSDTLNNLCADSYTVTVTDDNMCTNDTTLVVGNTEELIAFIDSFSNVSCYGYSDGYARVGIDGDKGIDFSYTWEDSLRLPVGTDTNYIADMPGGLYYVTVIENGGDNRIDSTSVTIQEPALLSTGISSTNPLCFGDENGAINLTVSGGSPLYSYIWSTGQTTEDLDNIPASPDYYRVTVTDQKGCQVTDSALLTVPDQLFVSITVLQELRCNGYTNGILQADVTGGFGTIDYLWNDQSGQTTAIATGLEAGTYIVTVTDDNSCQDTASSVLTDPEPVIISSVDSSHVSCKGLSDGSILITPAGGTPPYTYDWDRIPVDTNYVADLSAAFGGVYSVLVSDVNECPPALFQMQIKEPDIALDITEDSHTDNLCFGGSEGELGVTSSGGWENHEFSFNGVDWGTTATFTGLLSGSYYIKVRDAGECYDSVLISISEPDEISISEVLASHQNVLCYGDNTGQLEVLVSGGTPDYEYSSDNVSWDVNPLFENLSAASYIIWVRDDNECVDSAIFSISQPDRILIDPVVSGDTIDVIATGGSPPLFYSLDGGSLQITGLFTNLSEGEYSVSVIDGNNCSADTSVVVGIEPPIPGTEIIIYDAFSPNADGKNDVWNIGNIRSYPGCKVKIFNSWGIAVFISAGYDEPWDGKHNDNDLPAGTYYYYIDLGNGNGTYTGTVNIVK